MITAFVQFKLRERMSLEKAKEFFSSLAPKYRGVEGLIRKCYLLSEDGGTGGAFYLWKSKKDAERLYTDEWKKSLFDRYGSEPSVTYFHTPVVVDNLSGEIIKD